MRHPVTSVEACIGFCVIFKPPGRGIRTFCDGDVSIRGRRAHDATLASVARLQPRPPPPHPPLCCRRPLRRAPILLHADDKHVPAAPRRDARAPRLHCSASHRRSHSHHARSHTLTNPLVTPASVSACSPAEAQQRARCPGCSCPTCTTARRRRCARARRRPLHRNAFPRRPRPRV